MNEKSFEEETNCIALHWIELNFVHRNLFPSTDLSKSFFPFGAIKNNSICFGK